MEWKWVLSIINEPEAPEVYISDSLDKLIKLGKEKYYSYYESCHDELDESKSFELLDDGRFAILYWDEDCRMVFNIVQAVII